MKKAVLIQAISKYSSFFVQVLITMILARLVAPQEFGVLAIVTVFVAFFSTISDVGFSSAVVQFDLDEHETGALFGFSLILGVVLTILFCAASFPISWFYGDEELIPLCCVASLSLLFGTLNMVPNGLLLRATRFLSIGIRLFVATLASGIMAAVLAVNGFGVYALVLQFVASSAVVLVWNLLAVSMGRLNFNFMPVIKKVFSYSAFQFGFTLVNYFSRNLDNLLIGKIMGSEVLGYYDKAYKLTTYPVGALAGVAGTVIQPYMARFQDDSPVIFSNYTKVIKILSLFGAYIAALLFCTPTEVVLFLYGDQWLAVVPMFQALSLTIYVQMIGGPSGGYFQSLGRTDLQFKTGIFNTTITVVMLFLGFWMGSINILAVFIALAFWLHMVVIAVMLVKKGFGESVRCYAELLPEIALAIISILACFCFAYFFSFDMAISFFVKFCIVTVIFTVGYWLTGQFSVAMRILKNKREDTVE